jgi:hypothetical protein
MAETIVTGRKYRVCVDVSNDTWNVVSFWGKASDVELDDGSDVQSYVDNINTKITGILSGTLSDSTTTAPTSKLLKDQIDSLNTNFNNSVTTIFNKLKDYGYTPSSTKLADVITSITNMYNGRYTAGQDNIKNGTLSSSDFSGSVANNKYNVKSSKAGYVTNGETVHSIDVQTITQTIGVDGTYTIPAGYHSGSGKVSFSATAGTASATTTSATGNVTVNLGATGYYDKVTINQTNAYNAGITAGKKTFSVTVRTKTCSQDGNTSTVSYKSTANNSVFLLLAAWFTSYENEAPYGSFSSSGGTLLASIPKTYTSYGKQIYIQGAIRVANNGATVSVSAVGNARNCGQSAYIIQIS